MPLTHAQTLMTAGLNEYIQDGINVDATAAAELNVEGRLFKKAVGAQITDAPQNFDIISFDHLNEDIDAAAQKDISHTRTLTIIQTLRLTMLSLN